MFKHLKGVVLDWAGTMIDHGSCAPAIVFQEVFHRRGVEISAAQAREPMGKAKRDHIASIAAMPEVATAWQSQFAAPVGEGDIDAMYADFLPLQKEVLGDHSQLIEGAAEVAQQLRDAGLKIGSSTGYTRELMDIVAPAAERQGYQPDCCLCAEDAPRGRPAPFLIFEAAKRLDIWPLWYLVKVDDTPVGIEAGRNAGCWTVGVTQTGNGVGLSQAEFDSLAKNDGQRRVQAAASRLLAAGAHLTIRSVSELMPALAQFDKRLDAGERP